VVAPRTSLGRHVAIKVLPSHALLDARSGTELKGEPIPQTLANTWISPDGRFFAHPEGNRVELIPLQPDDEELSYRLLHVQSNSERYREGYEAARAARDDFAARFYLNLPTPFTTGVNGGVAYGSSDRYAASPAPQPTPPADLAAMVYHRLGVDPQTRWTDRLGRPLVLCEGTPIRAIRGSLRAAPAGPRPAPSCRHWPKPAARWTGRPAP
jgi:hypothetical protein